MRLLDLFCGAGGCGVGYHRAGFDVTGVDIKPQSRYPFAFHQADALEFLAAHGREFDVIHASPPCQKYTQVNIHNKLKGRAYPDLLGPTRDLLVSVGQAWVIENVPGSPMGYSIQLCGSAFGLKVRRHRRFESSHLLFGLPCNHGWQTRTGNYPTCWRPRPGVHPRSSVVQVYGNTAGKALWPEAMGIDWMTSDELSQAIPPAYTEFVGRQMLNQLATAQKEAS